MRVIFYLFLARMEFRFQWPNFNLPLSVGPGFGWTSPAKIKRYLRHTLQEMRASTILGLMDAVRCFLQINVKIKNIKYVKKMEKITFLRIPIEKA